MKTSLGIWAFGPMSTRFVPGGYRLQWVGESMEAKLNRAVEGLGDLIDGYEFHYPGELNPGNLDAVCGALDGRDIDCVASRSVLQWRFIDSFAERIDEPALREAKAAKDAVRADELAYAALGA